MAELDWQGLRINSADGGASISGIVDQLRVVLPDPWQVTELEELVEEWHQVWRHPGGAEAHVRWVFDETLSVRVTISAEAAVDLEGPTLAGEWSWPPRVHAAGTLAWLAAELPDGRVLHLEQTRGEADVVDGELRLLASGRLAAGTTRMASWRGQLLPDWLAVAGRLPLWWPDRVVREVGDELELALPDAAVTTAGRPATVQGEVVVLEVPEGRRRHEVHQGSGTVHLDLWGSPGVPQVAERRAFGARGVDERHLDAGALAALLAVGTPLPESCAGLLGRPTPEAVLVAARTLAASGDPDLGEVLAEAAERLPVEPGSELARVAVAVVLGVPVVGGALRTEDARSLNPIEQAVVDTEATVLAGRADAGVWRVLSLLGWGLPGRTNLDDRLLALVAALAEWLPEGLEPPRGVPTGLSVARSLAVAGLVADQPSDHALVWLLS